MGGITSILKAGANNAMNTVKSYDYKGHINSALSMAGVDMPKLEVPDAVKNWNFNIDPSIIKLPTGVDNYISPVASTLLSHVNLPSELGSIPLPSLPDYSSVTSQVEGYLSGMGFSTSALGIRSIEDILKEPDITSLKAVQFASPVDLNNMPDITTIMDDVDIGGIQSQIDNVTQDFPQVGNFDISKYF